MPLASKQGAHHAHQQSCTDLQEALKTGPADTHVPSQKEVVEWVIGPSLGISVTPFRTFWPLIWDSALIIRYLLV